MNDEPVTPAGPSVQPPLTRRKTVRVHAYRGRTFHGESGKKNKLYGVWCTMRQRCNDPGFPGYKDYGGRGITVCTEWNDFAVFRDWALANGYKEGMTIERVDVNKGYYPGNCTWIPRHRQATNRRDTFRVRWDGKEWCLRDLCRHLNANYKLVWAKMTRGMSLKDALVVTPRTNGIIVQRDGKDWLLRRLCTHLGVPYLWVYRRMKKGLPLEEAVLCKPIPPC